MSFGQSFGQNIPGLSTLTTACQVGSILMEDEESPQQKIEYETIPIIATLENGEKENTAVLVTNKIKTIVEEKKSEKMIALAYDVAVTGTVQTLVPIPVVGAAAGAYIAKVTRETFGVTEKVSSALNAVYDWWNKS